MLSLVPERAPVAGLGAAGFGQAARLRQASAEALNAQAWASQRRPGGGSIHTGASGSLTNLRF